MDQQEAEHVTIPAAARRLGIGRRQIDRAVESGALPVYDMGAWPRVRWADVTQWVEAQQRRTDPREGLSAPAT